MQLSTKAMVSISSTTKRKNKKQKRNKTKTALKDRPNKEEEVEGGLFNHSNHYTGKM